MKLAFCLFNYFPFGGLQRDFLRIAMACVARGHDVHVFTAEWNGERPSGLTIHVLPVRGWSNHARAMSFAKAVEKQLKQSSYDRVIGFNKMPHLDFYYAADVCYQARVRATKPWWVRLTPRYRTWVALESAVFAASQSTQILLIAPNQQAIYEACYHTEANRFHLLPPGIAHDRRAPVNAASTRQQVRSSFSIPPDHILWLMVGSSFNTKGVDRAIAALAALPQALRSRSHLWVIGQDEPGHYQEQAMSLGVHSRVRFLGGRQDVPRFLLAADVLIHPARHENTGTVLLEALVAGLPVITVGACGYAHFVEESGAGVVLPEPFDQAAWNVLVASALPTLLLPECRERALAFAETADIYSMPEKAADLICEGGSS